jgi:hypothetical protein
MSLDSYGNLQVEVATWLRRADLVPEIPTFITLAEAQFNRKLRSARMITRVAAFAISAQTMALPSDFVSMKSVRLVSPARSLRWVSDTKMDELLDTTEYTAGSPSHYTIEGANIRFSPVPATAYTAALVYYASLPPLSTNTTNWLLQSHPDAYLYGALLQSAPYLRADERLPMWAEMLRAIITDINGSDAGVGGALDPQPSTSFAGLI